MMDPRRLGEYDSDLSEEDQGDVLCILHPASPSAMAVASRIVDTAPQHTISRAQMPIRVLGADDGQPIVQPDTMELAQQGLVTRDLALRLSAELKDPLAGFTFGRNEQRCDFVFNYATTDGAKRISNIHFRIWLSEAGIIMLEDQSTNGTWVEGKHLRSKNRESNPPGRYKHTLTHGTLIKLQMVPGQDDDVQFVVRIPRRDGPAEDLWDNNVAEYFQRLVLARERRERAKARENGAVSCYFVFEFLWYLLTVVSRISSRTIRVTPSLRPSLQAEATSPTVQESGVVAPSITRAALLARELLLPFICSPLSSLVKSSRQRRLRSASS